MVEELKKRAAESKGKETVERSEFEAVIEALNRNHNLVLGLTVGVIVVMLVLLITLVIQSFDGSEASYQNLNNQIAEQNAKIDEMYTILQLDYANKNP